MIKKLILIALVLLVYVESKGQVFDCETISYKVSYEIQGKNLIEESEVVLQINNRNGDRYAKIEIPFTIGDKLSKIEAGILDTKGNVLRKLKSSEISTVSAISNISLYEDDFVKKFELIHNVYPYQVYYKYKITYGKFIEIANWYPFLNPELPCVRATLHLTVPKDFPIRYNHKDVELSIETFDKTIKYTWNGSYSGTYTKEIYTLPLSELVPSVKITPLNFNYGINGSFKSWVDFGNWVYHLNEGLNKLPETEQKQIDKLTQGMKDPKAISQILYRYLQDRTRYINVKLDVGGLKPYPAEYVAINKYGDCKALTNYMKAMLEYAGVPSYYSLIYASRNPVRPIVDFPGQYFNHVILMVPYEQDTAWLECTNNISPFGYLGTFTQGREAFIIDRDNSRFVRTPELCIEKSAVSVNSHFELDGSGNSVAELNLNLRGYAFDVLNSTLLNEKEKEKFVHEFVPFSGFELLDWKMEKTDRESDELILYMKVKPVNFPKRYGKDLILSGFNVGIPDFEQPGTRKLPVRFNYPLHHTDTMTFNIPKSFNISHSLTEQSLESEFGKYAFHIIQNDHEVRLIKSLTLFRNDISLIDYPRFYDFLTMIKNQESKNAIIINKKL
jgi:hypothetical protein